MTNKSLSGMAGAIIDGYWSPDDKTGENIIKNAIAEFAEFMSEGTPYTWGDDIVSDDEFILALAEVVRWRQERNS